MPPERFPLCAGASPRAAAARATGVQRRHPADDLEKLRDELDHLIRLAREEGRSRPSTEDLDEDAYRIGSAIGAVFRRHGLTTPVNPPKWRGKHSAGW